MRRSRLRAPGARHDRAGRSRGPPRARPLGGDPHGAGLSPRPQTNLVSRVSDGASKSSRETPMSSADTPPSGAWSKILAPYREPRTGRSIFEISVTVGPLLAIWAAAWALHARGWWWAALV